MNWTEMWAMIENLLKYILARYNMYYVIKDQICPIRGACLEVQKEIKIPKNAKMAPEAM